MSVPARTTGSRARRATTLFVALGATFAAPAGAGAAVPSKDISTPGPLNHVHIGAELSCQVAHTGDATVGG